MSASSLGSDKLAVAFRDADGNGKVLNLSLLAFMYPTILSTSSKAKVARVPNKSRTPVTGTKLLDKRSFVPSTAYPFQAFNSWPVVHAEFHVQVWTGSWATGVSDFVASFGSDVAETAVVGIHASSRLVVAYQDKADSKGKLWYGDNTTGAQALGVVPAGQTGNWAAAVGVALTSGGPGDTVKVM